MKRKSNCFVTILFLIYLALLVWIMPPPYWEVFADEKTILRAVGSPATLHSRRLRP